MKKAWLFAPILFLLAACPSAESSSENYPDDPSGLKIRLHEDGGMMPLSYNVYITTDSASWEMWRGGEQTILSWKPTEDEINELYTILKANKFDKIKSRSEGEVYDRGGLSVAIDLDGKSYELNNSGSHFIESKWSDNFSAITSAIWQHSNKHVESQKIPITIIPDDFFKSGEFTFEFRVNDVSVYSHTGALPQDTVISFYPGYNELYMQLFYADSVTSYGSPETYKWLGENAKIDSLNHQMRISFTAGELDYEIE